MTQKPNTQSDEANLCNSQSAPSSAHPDLPEGSRNVPTEMILIGNILNTPALMNEYNRTLLASDFSDPVTRDIYLCLQEYARLYDDDEVTEPHFNATLVNLRQEHSTLCRSLNQKKPWKIVYDIKRLGGKSTADSWVYQDVKKRSILRNMHSSGYNVDGILSGKDFRSLTIRDIQQLVLTDVNDRLQVPQLSSCEDFGANMTQRIQDFFFAPEIGYQTPFPFINQHLHGLYKNDLTLIGGLSNTGKGRFLMTLLIWLIVKEGQTVCLLSNEMTSDDVFKCLICTLMNNPELHGKQLRLTQTDIVQNRFKDAEGQYILRNPDESKEALKSRVEETSPEYRDYFAIAKWWEENFNERFLFVQVADDYSTERLRNEIQLAKDKGCTVLAYDTLKSHQSSQWEDLVQAATDLSELIKSDKDGLVGLATFQLTEDALSIPPEQLTQKHISRAKGIYHLADNMLMFIPLRDEQKFAYEVCAYPDADHPDEPCIEHIDKRSNVVAFRIVKNRRGNGKNQTYAVQTNLDRNIWRYAGELNKRFH